MPSAAPVVLLSRRDAVLAAVLRLAALSGTRVDVWSGGGPFPPTWRTAAVVLADPDCLPLPQAAAHTRRAGILLVTLEPPDAAAWRSAGEIGADQVIVLPHDDRQLLDLLDAAGEGARPRAPVMAVIGGCGGAGASTLAAAVALTAGGEPPTILIDADPLGGGLDLLLGVEHLPGVRWPELVDARGRLGAAALAEALVAVGDLRLLSWDRARRATVPADVVAAVLDAAGRAGSLVVVDLPRRLDESATVALAAADVVVLVVPARVRAVASAGLVAATVTEVASEVRLVVRDPATAGLTSADVGRALGLAVSGTVDSESAVRHAAEHGEPPIRRGRGSLTDASRALLALVGNKATAA